MAKQAGPTKRIQGLIPENDARAFESLAEQNGRSIASELRIAILQHLKANGRRPR